MYGKVVSACLHGIDGKMIEVEIDISSGLPQINMVGLPDMAVKESVERVRAAVKNCGFSFPLERITVNLAPANLRKEGASFDLAIAAGLLLTSGQIKMIELTHTLFLGELSLDGAVKPVPGVLSMVHTAKGYGFTTFVLPQANSDEARLIGGIRVIGITNLLQLREISTIQVEEASVIRVPLADYPSPLALNDDYGDVNGQQQAKRAMMIAAAGMHNIILVGPPGTGKTMLARRLPTILPPMSEEEALEVTKIYSASCKLNDESRFLFERPFRSPHHTISSAGLIGGGSIPKPGEVSLAHRGVLFLDELPEFSRSVLEVLRQPVEERSVTIGRARAVCTFPCHFILAASMNPCPCGYLGADSLTHYCTCPPFKIGQYRSKISGPLLDRIDLHVEVCKPNLSVADPRNNLTSEQMLAKVIAAHELQRSRHQGTSITFNAELSGRLLRRICALQPEAERMLQSAFDALGFSARAYDRILRLSRTIADLENFPSIHLEHVAEALQYRSLDKRMLHN